MVAAFAIIEQKLQRSVVSEELLVLYKTNPSEFFVAVCYCGIETVKQERRTNAKNPKEKTKSAGHVLWPCWHILIDYLEKGRTINAECYSNLLDQLK